MASNAERPIIIKKVKKVSGGGHHGGAWKVAYADFVTAMMAFFMLLWLLNVSDQETLTGLADYFTPTNASMSNSSGAGDILAGTALADQGASHSGSITVSIPQPTEQKSQSEGESKGGENTAREVVTQDNPENWDAKLVTTDDLALKAAVEAIKDAIQKSPELLKHQDQVIVEETPEGLRIQLVDKDQRPMFYSGSFDLYPFASQLLAAVGQVVQRLPNRVALKGHTNNSTSSNNAEYSNWELSADRANAARRVLAASGVSRDRFSEVTGKAATEPLFPDSPERPENKRVTLLVLREAPVVAPSFFE